jgi:acyl-ACP thioesterase
MEPVFVQNFEINDMVVDRFGRLRPSMVLLYAQTVATHHGELMNVGYNTLNPRRMFWAVIRHRVQISRLPRHGETIRIETWPMPATRSSFPRSVIAYDEAGNECFRAISLWVLMDLDKRSMILPGKSGISVVGTLRGLELDTPNGLVAKDLRCHQHRSVCFTDLDRNGHMNNTKYLDWISDLLPSQFHENHQPREMTVCYFSESREGQSLQLSWDFPEEGCLLVDAHRQQDDKLERVFSARYLF